MSVLIKCIKIFLFNFNYRLTYLYRLYIKKIHDCDNCGYFGGCMCDHIDEHGNCLGWKSAGWHPIHGFIYDMKIRRLAKKYRKLR